MPVLREIKRNIEEPESEREFQCKRRSTRENQRPIDSSAINQREVSIGNERVRLITQLISSDVFKITPPSLNQKVVRSVVE